MNGVPEFYEVKMKQTSKGIWYCDGFTASMENAEDAIRTADIAMTRIETVLKAHNVVEPSGKEDEWKEVRGESWEERNARLKQKKEEK